MAVVALFKRDLAKEDEQLLAGMLKGFGEYASSCNYGQSHVTQTRQAVRHYAQFAGVGPWGWDKANFIAWSASLERAKKKRSTRRSYQQRVVSFYNYLLETDFYRAEVKRLYGVDLEKFITASIRIRHHVEERESTKPPLTPEEFKKLLSCIESKIGLAQDNGDELKVAVLQRDLAMVTSLRFLGCRSRGLLSINTTSFAASIEQPEFGRYGQVLTIEKGRKGSGSLAHTLVVDSPLLPPVLAWYENGARIRLMHAERPNEKAFFLNSQGCRLSYASLWSRINLHLKDAGLGGRSLSSHSFRHMRTTERTIELGTAVASQQANHASLQTTTVYTHLTQEHVRKAASASIKAQIKKFPLSAKHLPGVAKADQVDCNPANDGGGE